MKSSVFKLKLELLSALNHCSTSSVKDLVNWHSKKVRSIESGSPQYMQLLSDLQSNALNRSHPTKFLTSF